MVLRDDLVHYLDRLLLAPCQCEDASNNGLQVEGAPEIARVCFGVDACQQLFDAAAERQAAFIFVHHGLSWGDSLRYLTDLNARRVGPLFRHDISLYAAHLPLDQHPEVGHNAVITQRLGIRNPTPFFEYSGQAIGCAGDLPHPLPLTALTASVNQLLNTESQTVPAGPVEITRVGIVSGGAADAVGACKAAGIDCLITGEMGHTHYHAALEWGVAVIAAGHYRSECPGVETVMQRVREVFEVVCEFIDLPTGY